LLPRRPGWTGNLLNFFSGLQTLEQRAKKCIELRREYDEEIPSLVAVACFLAGQTKDVSVPPRSCILYECHISAQYTLPGSISHAVYAIFINLSRFWNG
jgi:hypothetical protein